MEKIIITVLFLFFHNSSFMISPLLLAGIKQKELLSWKVIICFMFYNPISFFIITHDNSWQIVALFVLFLIYTIITKVCTGCSFSRSFDCSIFGYIIASILQLIGVIIMYLLKFVVDENDYESPKALVSAIITFTFVMAFSYVFPLEKLREKIEQMTYATPIIAIIIAILFLIPELFMPEFRSGLSIPILSSMAVFLIIAVLITIKAASDRRRKHELKIYNTYIPIINEMIDDIKKQQHLYNNQIQSLVRLCATNRIDELTETIGEISDTYSPKNTTYNFLHLENQLLAGLLFSKYNEADKQGKRLQIDIKNYAYKSDCSNMEMVDISGILLDNAIEASGEGDIIYVTIGDGLLGENEGGFNEAGFNEARFNEARFNEGGFIDGNVHSASDVESKGESENATIALESKCNSGNVAIALEKGNKNGFSFAVENPGPVVTSEFIHNIFSNHFSSKKDKRNHGMGLSILRKTVDKHGGSINVCNTYPEGEEKPFVCISIKV